MSCRDEQIFGRQHLNFRVKEMKAELLEREIIDHRNQMKYDKLPAIIAKYHRKYHPKGTILGYLCLAESTFTPPEIAFDSLEFIGNYDCQETLVNIQKGLELGTQEECADLLILKSYCQLWIHDPKSSLATLEGVSTTNLLSNIQLRCVKAWAYYLLKHDDYKQELEQAYLLTKEVKTEGNLLLQHWIENALFSYCSLINSQQVAQFYLEQHVATNNLKQIGIMYLFLSNLISELETQQPLSKIQQFSYLKSTTLITSNQERILKLIRIWLPRYERLVTNVCQFPVGSRDTPLQMERVERVELVYDWWVYVEMFPARYQDDGIGDIIDRHYRILEILYRGTKHTFLSLKLLRYIANTFFSLSSISRDSLCLDEKKEAGLAVASYVFHWEKKFTMILDTKMKEIRDSKHGALDSPMRYSSHRMSGQISQIPYMTPHIYDKETDSPLKEKKFGSEEHLSQTITIKKVESESVEDVVGVLVTGIKLILKQHEGNLDMVYLID